MKTKTITITIGDGRGNEVRFECAGRVRRAKEIINAANDEGTIQAGDARELFSSPENHTTMSLGRALELAGFELVVV